MIKDVSNELLKERAMALLESWAEPQWLTAAAAAGLMAANAVPSHPLVATAVGVAAVLWLRSARKSPPAAVKPAPLPPPGEVVIMEGKGGCPWS